MRITPPSRKYLQQFVGFVLNFLKRYEGSPDGLIIFVNVEGHVPDLCTTHRDTDDRGCSVHASLYAMGANATITITLCLWYKPSILLCVCFAVYVYDRISNAVVVYGKCACVVCIQLNLSLLQCNSFLTKGMNSKRYFSHMKCTERVRTHNLLQEWVMSKSQKDYLTVKCSNSLTFPLIFPGFLKFPESGCKSNILGFHDLQSRWEPCKQHLRFFNVYSIYQTAASLIYFTLVAPTLCRSVIMQTLLFWDLQARTKHRFDDRSRIHIERPYDWGERTIWSPNRAGSNEPGVVIIIQ